MGGVQAGYGEEVSAGLREVLANHLMTQERKARLGSGCVEPRGELLNWTVDIVKWWKEQFLELLNETNMSYVDEFQGSLMHIHGRGH